MGTAMQLLVETGEIELLLKENLFPWPNQLFIKVQPLISFLISKKFKVTETYQRIGLYKFRLFE